ncbi:MAG: GHKL domain-containing protein [gamma proteobacterium symbiont of Bathyaustriella thionipta]|nr:GHKL domain-containing protein [gamma proteobacterium symbiont of Bathyaustriella thionipta]MCU7952735.1 GHKL domain-containing protein [gamma proteobacterium symbiont of Bathyaustriella thionipta]
MIKFKHFFMMTSINRRIIVGAISIVTSFMLLTGFTLSNTFYHSAYSALEDSLTGQIYLLMADREFIPTNLYSSTQILANKPLPYSKDGSNTTYSQLAGYITQSDGTILWQSGTNIQQILPPVMPLSEGKIEHGKKIFQKYEINGIPYISLSIAIYWNSDTDEFPLIYHISDDLSLLNNKISDYQYSLWSNLIIMSLILFIALFLILRWGLKPLRDVEQEIKSVEQGKQALLKNTYPDELVPLTHNINQLIQYERQQQQRYHHALADLAHSLKTPLSIIRGNVYDNNNPDNYLNTVNDAIERMNTIVEYQLQRAVSNTPSPHIQYLQLTPVVKMLIESMKKIYRDKNINFDVSIEPDIQLKIDEGDFMEILGNLLDNACKWCKDEINLTIKTSEVSLYIHLTDNGPGIVADKINDITRRGVRADELTPGHGVGLAIVQDIVDVYDGKIKFLNSKTGGLEININFNL